MAGEAGSRSEVNRVDWRSEYLLRFLLSIIVARASIEFALA